MARIPKIADKQEVKLEENEELASLDDIANKPGEIQELPEDVKQESIETEAVDTTPEKYRGKSLEDVVRMHQEAEKQMGRQSSEVGDLRKSVDDLLRVKEEEASSKTEAEPEVDFYDDPKGSVNRAVESSESVKQIKEFLKQQKQEAVLNKISAKHPDYEVTVADSNFMEWVNSSPLRSELLQRAHQNYDFNAADELLSNWGTIKGSVSREENLNEMDRKLQVKAASTGGKGSGESMSRKIYRRSDIINLKVNDPKKHESIAHLIEQAYIDGRVK